MKDKLGGMHASQEIDPIRYVQPSDGILKDYDQVEVAQNIIAGSGDWSRIPIEIIATFKVEKYDDLSVRMVCVKVMVPGVEQEVNQP